MRALELLAKLQFMVAMRGNCEIEIAPDEESDWLTLVDAEIQYPYSAPEDGAIFLLKARGR